MPELEGLQDDGTMEIRLRLKPGRLEDLVGGQWAARFWLSQDPDGTYRLHATVPVDAPAEALCRLIHGTDEEGVPPIPEAAPDVQKALLRLRTFFPAPRYTDEEGT